MRMLRASMTLGVISAVGLLATLPDRKLTKEFLESEIKDVEYNRLGGTITHCTIHTKSGFTFTGESACVNPNNFDPKIGEQVAYDNAFEKMWLPYGFWLHKAMLEFSNLNVCNAQCECDNDESLSGMVKDWLLPKTERLSFGDAVVALKEGLRVEREGWNGKGMFLYYVPENKYPASRNEHGTMIGVFENDMVPYREYIALKTVDNQVVPWAPSISDALAEDWQIVE